jgi:hypothetical protein
MGAGVKGSGKGDGGFSELGLGEAGDFHLMLAEVEFERVVAVDRDYDAFAMAGFGEARVAAVDAGEVPAALLQEPREIFTGNLFHTIGPGGNREAGLDRHLDDLIVRMRLPGFVVYGEPAFDRLCEIGAEFREGFARRAAAGEGGHFGPEAAFVCLVDDGFEFHGGNLA